MGSGWTKASIQVNEHSRGVPRSVAAVRDGARWSSPHSCHLERVDHESAKEMIGARPTDHTATPGVDDRGAGGG